MAAGAARLVTAVAQLPPAQLESISASLECDLSAELVGVLAGAAGAGCASAGLQKERAGSAQALLCE